MHQQEYHGNVERISHPIFVGGFEGISWEESGFVEDFEGYVERIVDL